MSIYSFKIVTCNKSKNLLFCTTRTMLQTPKAVSAFYDCNFTTVYLMYYFELKINPITYYHTRRCFLFICISNTNLFYAGVLCLHKLMICHSIKMSFKVLIFGALFMHKVTDRKFSFPTLTQTSSFVRFPNFLDYSYKK